MNNGDVIVFGGSVHGVEQDLSITEGRISIAVFTQLIDVPNDFDISLFKRVMYVDDITVI